MLTYLKLRELSKFSRQQHLIALITVIPAILAALGMQFHAAFYSMIFTGGNRVFFTNICELVLFPYFLIFILALGTLILPSLPSEDPDHITRLDYYLIRFFCGVGILMLLGFILGFLTLLTPLITLPIFCITLYLYFLCSPSTLKQFASWLTARDLSTISDLNDFPKLRIVVIFQRGGILLLIGIILLIRGIVPEVVLTTDVMQVYSSYLDEVRLNHGIWLDPSHPVVLDFLVGRANGVHLFLSNFTSSYVNQLIGCMYLFSMAAVTHRVVRLVVPKTQSLVWRIARCTFPDNAVLWVLCTTSLTGFATEYGKYHLQTGALFLFLTWVTLLFIFFDREQAGWGYRALFPVCIAISLSLPQYELLVFPIFMLAIAALYYVQNRSVLKYFFYLLVIGSVVCLCSFLFNQLYIGIPETNPYYLFIQLANPMRLHLWTSPEQIMYLNMSYPVEMKLSLSQLTFVSAVVRILSLGERIAQALAMMLDILPILLASWFLFHFRIYRRLLGQSIFVLLCQGALSASLLVFVFVSGNTLSPLSLFQVNVLLWIVNLTILLVIALTLLAPQRILITQGKQIIRKTMHPTDKRIYAFIFVFFSYFLGAWALLALVNHPSFVEEFVYQGIYPVIALFLLLILLIKFFRELFVGTKTHAYNETLTRLRRILSQDTDFRTSNTVVFMIIITIVLLASVVEQSYNYMVKYPISITIAARYFVGREKLEATILPLEDQFPWVNFTRCLDIGKAVPGDAAVLPLNALAAMPACNFTALLPRNKIIHNFESVLAPYWKMLLFDQPQQAYTIYKQQGVNYFYIRKADRTATTARLTATQVLDG